jgi:hypothetical protein
MVSCIPVSGYQLPIFKPLPITLGQDMSKKKIYPIEMGRIVWGIDYPWVSL